MSQFDFLDKLLATIASREGADPKESHVAKMLKRGTHRIAKKVGEEGVEVAIAAAMKDREGMISESADLLFHLLVLWHKEHISPAEVAAELQRREGTSGIAEKASRPAN